MFYKHLLFSLMLIRLVKANLYNGVNLPLHRNVGSHTSSNISHDGILPTLHASFIVLSCVGLFPFDPIPQCHPQKALTGYCFVFKVFKGFYDQFNCLLSADPIPQGHPPKRHPRQCDHYPEWSAAAPLHVHDLPYLEVSLRHAADDTTLCHGQEPPR